QANDLGSNLPEECGLLAKLTLGVDDEHRNTALADLPEQFLGRAGFALSGLSEHPHVRGHAVLVEHPLGPLVGAGDEPDLAETQHHWRCCGRVPSLVGRPSAFVAAAWASRR